jgi:hypothetical protein
MFIPESFHSIITVDRCTDLRFSGRFTRGGLERTLSRIPVHICQNWPIQYFIHPIIVGFYNPD